MSEFTLTPPPNGDEAPSGRLTYMSELEGKTIRKVIECPCGLMGHIADVVIVCDDDTWLPLVAEPDGSDNATLEVLSHYGYRRNVGITDILHPRECFEAGLVNQAQYELLERKMGEQRAADNAAKAARLRAEAAKLESGGI